VARNNSIAKPSGQLDLTDFSSVTKLYESVKPDFIINCVGILNANAETNPDKEILINSYFPQYLERICSSSSCKLIHISTDFVFSGKKWNYFEKDFMDADGYYAISKALGEIRKKKDLTIRTSISGPELYSNGIGLFQWFSTCSGCIN